MQFTRKRYIFYGFVKKYLQLLYKAISQFINILIACQFFSYVHDLPTSNIFLRCVQNLLWITFLFLERQAARNTVYFLW